MVRLDHIHSLQDLTTAWQNPDLRLEYPRADISECAAQEHPYMKRLDITFGEPVRMTDLQLHFLTDFVAKWSSVLDDVRLWLSNMVLLRNLSLAILRLAAWDFCVVRREFSVETTTSDWSLPHWHQNMSDNIFRFHHLWVVLCHDLRNPLKISEALAELGSSKESCNLRVILFSLSDVSFAELAANGYKCSEPLPVLSDSAVHRGTPGMVALTQILTTSAWEGTGNLNVDAAVPAISSSRAGPRQLLPPSHDKYNSSRLKRKAGNELLDIRNNKRQGYH